MSDFDYDEIDKAINDILESDDDPIELEDEQPAPKAVAKPTPRPVAKPAPKPAEQLVDKPKTVTRPIRRPAPLRPSPNNQFIDIIASPRGLAPAKPIVKPAAPKLPIVPKPVMKPRPATVVTRPVAAAPKPVAKPVPRPVMKPAAERPTVASVATRTIVEETPGSAFVSEEIVQTVATPVDTPTEAPRPQLRIAPAPEYKPEKKPFIENLNVEKRPLSRDLPADHTDNIISTQNSYSRSAISSSTIDAAPEKGKRKPRKEKEKRVKKVKTPKPPREKRSVGGIIAFTFIILLIMILGAAAGFLIYLLLTN